MCLPNWIAEYMEFEGCHCHTYKDFKDSPGLIMDMDVRLAPLPALGSRKKLFQLFQLSCFWLTETSPERPRIRVQNVDTSDARCRLFHVFLPTQSYLANVHNLMVVCTTNSAMTKCQKICSKLESDSIAADPWVCS